MTRSYEASYDSSAECKPSPTGDDSEIGAPYCTRAGQDTHIIVTNILIYPCPQLSVGLPMTESSDPNARRRQLLQSIGVAGIASLAGCTVNTGGDDRGNSETSNPQMVQSANGWGWNTAARALQQGAEMYNEEVGANVSVEDLSDTWEQKFQTAVTSGTGAPDFSSIQNYDVTNYASVNGLKNLTSRIEETGITEDIVEGKWKAVSYNDKYYAIPWDLGPTGVFYKRDRYEEAGIDPQEDIETWDDFIEAGQQMPDDVAMFNLPPQEMAQHWRMLIRQRGGQAFTDHGAVAIASDDSIAVAQLIKDMQDVGITTRIEQWSAGWFTSFAEGTLASLPNGAWMDGTLRAELPDTAGNWGVFKLPAFEEGGNRASNRGGSNMAIPSQIEDEATVNRAFDYCLYAMTTPEVQNMMLKEYGLFPSLTTAYDADIYEEELDFYDGQAVFGLFAEVAQQIEPYNYTTDTPEAQQAIETELGNMLDGNKGPEQAMQDAAQTVADRTDRDLA